MPHLAVLRIDPVPGGRRHENTAPGLHQPVDDLLLQSVDGVLLIRDLVRVAVSQQLPEEGDVALEDQRVDLRLIVGDLCGKQNRLSVLTHATLRAGNHQPPGCGDRLPDLLPLLRRAAPLLPAAAGAGFGMVLRLRLPALRAPLEPPGLIVLDVLQLLIAHPAVNADASGVVAVVGGVLGHQILRGPLPLRAPDPGLRLPRVLHVHAIPPLDGGLGLGQLEDDVVHLLDAAGNARLRDDLLGMPHGNCHLAHGVVAPPAVVPLHMEEAAALDGDRAILHVVEVLHGQPVQLVAQHILDEPGKALVLFPPGGDLGLGDVGRNLALDIFRHDVAHMGRCPSLPLLLQLPLHQRRQLPASPVEGFPPVHIGQLILIAPLIPLQPPLPHPQPV